MSVKGKELLRTDRPKYLSPFEEMERWFEKAWQRPFSLMRSVAPMELAEFETTRPLVDIYEEGSDLVVKADIPGLRREDIDVHISDNILSVSGEKKTEEKVEKGDYYTYERREGSFYRRFELPFEVDIEKTTARLTDGVLEIRLPKTHEVESKSKKILISG